MSTAILSSHDYQKLVSDKRLYPLKLGQNFIFEQSINTNGLK